MCAHFNRFLCQASFFFFLNCEKILNSKHETNRCHSNTSHCVFTSVSWSYIKSILCQVIFLFATSGYQQLAEAVSSTAVILHYLIFKSKVTQKFCPEALPCASEAAKPNKSWEKVYASFPRLQFRPCELSVPTAKKKLSVLILLN